MARGYRTIRAVATALLLATAIGVGGMGGLTAALAADPGMVTLSGIVTAGGEAPLGGVHLTITEEDAEGGLAAVQAVTGDDGTFSADLFAWGTAATPATLTVAADDELVIVGEACSETWNVTLAEVDEIAWADAAPGPLSLVATRTILGEVCGTSATPAPSAAGGGGSESRSGGGRPRVTPPPTDRSPIGTPTGSDRNGPALTIGFIVGLLGTLLLLPGPGARRRR